MRFPITGCILSAALLLERVAAGAPLPPFPPPLGFPAMWFGANTTAGHNQDTLELISRHSMAGFGWQQGTVSFNYHHAETAGAQAASQAAQYLLDHNGSATAVPLFVYRHFQMAFTLFDVQAAAAHNDAYAGMFLRDHDNDPAAPMCQQPTPGNSTSPLYAWRNASAGAFWVDDVIGEVAQEGSVSLLFMDETDWNICGYNFGKDGCGNLSQSYLLGDMAAKLPALAGTGTALNAAGVWPLYSSKNLLTAAWKGLPDNATRPCWEPADAYVAALQGAGVGWFRFYEFWMGQGKELDAATIANVLLEAGQGIGLVARAEADATAVCPNTTQRATRTSISGREVSTTASNPSFTYALAAFLIARTSPYSYFGVSTGWYDADWCWHKEYDDIAVGCGLLSGDGDVVAAAIIPPPPQRTGTYTWFRAYSGCNVTVDNEKGTGSIVYL